MIKKYLRNYCGEEQPFYCNNYVKVPLTTGVGKRVITYLATAFIRVKKAAGKVYG